MALEQTSADGLSAGASTDATDALGDIPAFRNVPHNIEAEQALLGAILVNNEAQDRVSSFLQAEHFFEPIHGRIYETAGKLIQSGKQATPITLRTFFEHEEDIGDITVPQYIARLAANATSIINAADYGQTVHDLAVRRQLIMVGEDLVNVAYDSPVDFPPSKQIEDAEQRLYGLAETGKYGQGFESFGNALVEAVAMAGAAYERDGGLSGIASGLRDLDKQMGGLQQSDLIVLAGRPSMGKTSLATNIAFNVANARAKALAANPDADPDDPKLDGANVGFFSLEMSSEQLATRILAEQAQVSSEKIRRGMITEEEFRSLRVTSEQLSRLPLFIDQTGGINIAQLAARARRLKRQHGLGFIVVDYLQLLAGSSRTSGQGRVQEITEITTGLKALAKELAVPVMALSQLSRQVENREDKRPQLSDLRESGSIEQDADVVMFVYREEYYLERAQPREGSPEHLEWQTRMNEVYQVAEAIVGKQRHGPVGTVRLHFEGQYTRFSDLAQNDHIPEQY